MGTDFKKHGRQVISVSEEQNEGDAIYIISFYLSGLFTFTAEFYFGRRSFS